MTVLGQGRLPLAVEVVAGLEDRPQGGVPQRGGGDPGDEVRDRAGLAEHHLDQFAVDRIEVREPVGADSAALSGLASRAGLAGSRPVVNWTLRPAIAMVPDRS